MSDYINGVTFGLADPSDVAGMDGLTMLRKMIAGDLPAPTMARTLNFILREVDDGMARFEGQPTEDHYNPLRTVHGGWAATVLDSALGCAVQTTLDAGELYTTVEFKVNLVRPLVPEIGNLICVGEVVHRGRTIATSEASLKDEAGKLYAHATETCAIFPMSKMKA